MKDRVAIVGVGMIKFGELFEKSYEAMISEAYLATLKDAGITPSEIQAGWLGTYSGANIRREGLTGSALATIIGQHPKPFTRVENACATGSDAFRNACFAVAAGVYDVVLVVGAEKMRDVSSRDALLGRVRELPPYPVDYTPGIGLTTPAFFASYATRHMHVYGTTKEQMAMVAVKNHKNGILDPYSYMKFEVTVDQVLKSPMVCYPLNILDCCPTTDGAAAAIICNADIAKRYTDTPIYVSGVGLGTDVVPLQSKRNFVEYPATIFAAREAYRMARVGPGEVDVAEVHDCFTIAEIIHYEDLGFCKKGEGGRLIEEGETDLGGRIPVNPSGGLKAKGHPIGATGVAQICEIVWHLRGEAEGRQVKGAQVGLTHNLGATGSVACVTILRR